MRARSKAPLTILAIVLAASAAATFPANAITSPDRPASPHTAETARSAVGSKAVTCSSSNPKLAENLSQNIAKVLNGRKSMASVGLYDRTTNTSCTFDSHKTYDSASTVKPIVLGALLLAKDGHLTAKEKEYARKMIVHSDNNATEVLWRQLSDLKNPAKPDPVKIRQFLDAVGMKDTALNRDGSWGLTQVSASDQVKLLKMFTGDDSSVLTPQSRAYALGLMRNVQADQKWGTPAGAAANSAVGVKNGWLQRSQNGPDNPFDRGDWKVNSMGAFTGTGHDYGLVVLTENNRVPSGRPADTGWNYGIDTIEQVSRTVHRVLNPAESPSNGYSPQRPAV